MLCSTNRQCSNCSSVSFHTSIAMHAQGQFYWNLQSFLIRNVGRTSRKPVGIKRTCVYIVVVIVGSVTFTDYIARCTSPLCVVSCSFKCAGQATDLSSSNNVSHTATEANSICGNKTSALAVVSQYYTVIDIATFVECKRAEIYPSTTSHLLIYVETSFLSFMKNNIFSVVYALLYSLVAYINSIVSVFGDNRLIGNMTKFAVSFS